MKKTFGALALFTTLVCASPVHAVCTAPADANNPYVIGACCSQVGETHLDNDSVNILACLYETKGGDKIWKSMSPNVGEALVQNSKRYQLVMGAGPRSIEVKGAKMCLLEEDTHEGGTACGTINSSTGVTLKFTDTTSRALDRCQYVCFF